MRVKETPSVTEARSLIKRAVTNREVVLIIGRCEVEYKGRAASTLPEGERMVIIKEDGACLVHRPTGYEPVNWQPPGTIIKTQVVEDELVISSLRRRPREVLRIAFSDLKSVLFGSLEDTAQFAMYATEKTMQKAVFLQPDLVEEGLKPVKVEKEHPEGYIDILAVDVDGREVILELKRDRGSRNDVLQMNKYVSGYRETNPDVRGILVAPSLSKKAHLLLSQMDLEYKRLRLRDCERVVANAGKTE
jgi:hypothetical protein